VFQTNSILKDISEPEVGIDVILPIVVVYPILLYILVRNMVGQIEAKTDRKIVSNTK
jgi:hypothetical protein